MLREVAEVGCSGESEQGTRPAIRCENARDVNPLIEFNPEPLLNVHGLHRRHTDVTERQSIHTWERQPWFDCRTGMEKAVSELVDVVEEVPCVVRVRTLRSCRVPVSAIGAKRPPRSAEPAESGYPRSHRTGTQLPGIGGGGDNLLLHRSEIF